MQLNKLHFNNNIQQQQRNTKQIMQRQNTTKKVSEQILHKTLRGRQSLQTPSFCSNNSQSFNKDNMPYSNPLKIINLTVLNQLQQHNTDTTNMQNNKQCQSHREQQTQTNYKYRQINANKYGNMQTNTKTNSKLMYPQTQCIDSVSVDYKEKTFELMRKNAQLELNIKQSKADTANLEHQVEHLTLLIKQIIELIGINNNPSTNNSASINITTNISQQQNISLSQQQQKAYMINLANIKNMLNNININNSNINSNNSKSKMSSRPISIIPITSQIHCNSNLVQQNQNNQTVNNNNNNNSINETIKSKFTDADMGCDCEQNFNKIITQYKTMIQTMHCKLVKKQKANRILQQEIKKCKQQIQQLKQQAIQNQTLERQVCKKQQQILEITKKNKQYEQQIKNKEIQIERINKLLNEFEQGNTEKQENINKINKLQSQLKELNQKYEELLRVAEEKQKSLEGLVLENEELFNEKEKMKQRYKHEFIHFEEMSKLVEEKLIEVQYEMNFYKKQRNENFEKISSLQNQLKQYKANQQKKYYSFGESQKDFSVQVIESELQAPHEMYESIAEIIVEGSKSQANNDQCATKSYKRKISLDFNAIKQVPQQDSPRRFSIDKTDKDNWQLQCYEQSIKTLLQQNSRLKKSLLKLYKLQKDQGIEAELSKQIELEMKILLSTMPNSQQTQFEAQNNENNQNGYDTFKK